MWSAKVTASRILTKQKLDQIIAAHAHCRTKKLPLQELFLSAYLFRMSYRIRLIHSYSTAAIIFSINGLYHFLCSTCLYLDPAIHFFHIYTTKYILAQVTHVENKLEKTGFIKTILCSQ